MKTKKSILSTLFLLLLFGGCGVWWLISGVCGLWGITHTEDYAQSDRSSGSYVELSDYEAVAPLLRMDRSSSLAKKYGACYYSMVQPADGSTPLIVIVSKETNRALFQNEVTSLRGKLVKPHSQVANEISRLLSDPESSDIAATPAMLYLDTGVTRTSVIRLVEASFFLALIAYGLLLRHFWKQRPNANLQAESGMARRLFSKPALIAMFVVLLLAVILLLGEDQSLFSVQGVIIPSSY